MANRREGLWSLSLKGGRRPDATVQRRLEQRLSGRQIPRHRKLADFYPRESGTRQAPHEFLRIAESKKRRAGRQPDVESAIGLHRAEHYPKSDGLLGIRPDGEGTATSRQQHPARFAQSGVGARQMQQTKIHHHGIELSVIEGEGLRIALIDLDVRTAMSSLGHHDR